METAEFFAPLLNSLSRYLIILLASYFLTILTYPFMIGLITKAGLVKTNYLGEKIPVAAGLLFVLIIPIVVVLGQLLKVSSFTSMSTFLFLFIIISSGLMGFLDDTLGNHQEKGLRGHLAALIKEKRLTTGGFKLVFGVILGLLLVIGNNSILQINYTWFSLVDFFLFCLAVNVINSFDLRPGRAGKVFVVGFILIVAFSKNFADYLGLFLPILAVLLYYLPFDLRSLVMLGDTGSNLLGASLGMMLVWMLSDLGKIVVLLILIILQIVAEKYSLTRIIEKVSLLKYLDDLGRRRV